MILGISASGRKNMITDMAVKEILNSTELDYNFISLSNKKIGGCIGCLRCIVDNRCHVEDDWPGIAEEMIKAKVIVFGAPNYYGTINAIGHACLERTFCFRHQGTFLLAGKLGIIVSTGYDYEDRSVSKYIHRLMTSNQMAIIGSLFVKGYSQCYSCGVGNNCEVGNVVKDHGFLDKITINHLPPHFKDQKKSVAEARRLGKMIRSIIYK